jgi:hypothetical protein
MPSGRRQSHVGTQAAMASTRSASRQILTETHRAAGRRAHSRGSPPHTRDAPARVGAAGNQARGRAPDCRASTTDPGAVGTETQKLARTIRPALRSARRRFHERENRSGRIDFGIWFSGWPVAAPGNKNPGTWPGSIMHGSQLFYSTQRRHFPPIQSYTLLTPERVPIRISRNLRAQST